jgi:hypothetical protein
MKILVLRNMTPCAVVCWSGFLPLSKVNLSPDDGGKHLLQNVDAIIPLYTASYPGKTESSNSFPPLLFLFVSFLPISHLRK